AAFSDALKRAAVKFGVGRYLYRLPQQWCDYDPQKRRFVKEPALPESALPKPKKPAPKPEPKPAAVSGKVSSLPANGVELRQRLSAYEATLAKQGRCKPGDLIKHVVRAGVKAGFGDDLAIWSGPAILLAVEETKAFETRSRPGKQKEVA